MISVMGTCKSRPSSVGTSTIHPSRAWPSGTADVKIKSTPSRRKFGCCLSLRMKTISAATRVSCFDQKMTESVSDGMNICDLTFHLTVN